MTPAAVLSSIDRHYAAGNEFLNATEYVSHVRTGSCRGCTARTELAEWTRPKPVTLIPKQPDRFGG